MRRTWVFDSMPTGFWCDSAIWPTAVLHAGGIGFWAWCERLVGSVELRPQPCLELDGRACVLGLGMRLRAELFFRDAVCAHMLGVFNACIAGAAKRLEPIAGECLLRANFADVGAGPVYPLQWIGAVAWMALALHRFVVCDLAINGFKP